jgi:Uma2 family endonuclease
MSTISTPRSISDDRGIPLLVNGDRMTQAEFHRCYEACPEDEKWELIGGIVYNMSSPLSLAHSDYDDEVGFALGMYRRATPGVQVLHNATAILGEESEPQPDLGLRILPDYGGHSKNTADNYVDGAPELLVEVAHSRRAIAMHAKREDYERTGVLEYLVVCVKEQEVHWFYYPQRRYHSPQSPGDRAFTRLPRAVDRPRCPVALRLGAHDGRPPTRTRKS